MSGERVWLAVSLDVEEEGLFCGRYARRHVSTANTAALDRLTPLCRAGVRPTLFCAHSVFRDPASCAVLARMRDECGAEIGAHLHHWNTPPLSLTDDGASLPDWETSVPAACLSPELFAAKLETLLEAGRAALGERPVSFRMGRWDLHAPHWESLARAGVTTDASVRPLHCGKSACAGPDHFDAPSSPYWVAAGGYRVFELPLTVTPLRPWLPGLLRRLPDRPGLALRAGFSHWGALALLPVYHPLWLMRLVTSLYVSRGGRLLSLTWHSSELQPGATPHLPDAAAVDRLLRNISAWLEWLRATYDVRCGTMDELRRELGPGAPVAGPGIGDWTAPARLASPPGASHA